MSILKCPSNSPFELLYLCRVQHNSKTLEEAIKLKKELRKKVEGPNSTIEDTKRFRLALRAISDLRKLEKKKDQIKTAKNQEELYFKNKWDFAKKACKGSLEAVPELPGFSKTLADEYYPSTYSIPKIIDLSSLNQFPILTVNQEDENFKPFSMEIIKPKDIKKVLLNCNKKSSPGPDGIPYSILLKQ